MKKKRHVNDDDPDDANHHPASVTQHRQQS